MTKQVQLCLSDMLGDWSLAGVWHDRAGVQRGPGVPYSQIRILARGKWQLFYLKGCLERGGLKPHVVLAGDNSDLAETQDEEDLIDAPPSHDKVRLGPEMPKRLLHNKTIRLTVST